MKKVKEEKKSCSKSVEFRLSGNKVYQKGNDWEALIIYNLSVTQAPFNTNEFSLALSNRSAVLARLGVFRVGIEPFFLKNHVNFLSLICLLLCHLQFCNSYLR